MTDIGLMVRTANPVPDESQALTDDELSAVLLLAQQRSGGMDTKQASVPVKTPEPKKKTGWLVAAAAFAVVVAVVGATLLFGNDTSSEPPATTPPTTGALAPTTTVAPTTTIQDAEATTQTTTSAEPSVEPEALAFVEELLRELNEGDVAAASARFPEDMTFQSQFFSVQGIPRWFEHLVAMDSQFEIEECKPISGGTTRCVWLRTSEHEPYYPEAERAVYQFRLEDGLPVYSQVNHEKSGWWETELLFMEWLVENHPDVAETLYRIPGGQVILGGPRFIDAALEAELKKQYVPLWFEANN